MSGIRFEHVWKLYGRDSAAVIDLDLEINEGEFLVLVGPSGCGKTTSLRMLAGLERPSHGRIWMAGEDVTDVLPGRRDVAMVFQSYALYPNMTVYKNLAFGPRVRKDSREHIGRRVEEVAEILGISGLLQRHPSKLSGGQRQRVALGRAMIREPKLFLMDEPLSNLDAALRVQMRAELIRLHQRLEHTTTVYVTHDQVEALTMGDRVAVLKDGSLLQIGTPTQLYDDPVNAFVAGFIGSPTMNIMPGRLTGSAGQLQVSVFGATFPLPWALRGESSAPRDVLVGIRPDDLNPAGGAPPAKVRLGGQVDVCEQTGTAIYATVQCADAALVAKLPRHPLPAVGEQIELAFDPRDIHLFDGQTQDSLLFLLPMVWLVFASLDANATWSVEIPHLTGANFAAALSGSDLQSLINSIVLSGVSTAIATVCGALAAYALSRRRIPWKGPLLLIVLFLTGVPLAILIIPIFELFSDLGWLSILPCALFLAVTTLPFEIYLIKNFLDAVPQDLEEAARMERAGTVQILLKVIGPLAMPGIAAAAIFGFVTAWGSFLIPLVLITSPNQQPGSIAIFGFIGAAHVQYGNIAAFSLIYAVPIFLLYAISSRLFRGGFVLSGAVRG